MTGYRTSYYLRMLILSVALQFCTPAKRSGSLQQSPNSGFYSAEDFRPIKKFDTHVHLNTTDTPYIEQAATDNFQLLDIVDDRPFGIPMEEQEKIAILQTKAYPGRVVYATTFSVNRWEQESWQEETITHIKNALLAGAVAVKVWKNIGMQLKDRNGDFVMIDHPRFDLILEFLEDNHIPLIGHLGEPKDCWLPLDQMVLHKGYYSRHPEYHMYLHPEYPSYESHLKARDHMLQKHPRLAFIGAHLGSIEWSLGELAKTLDKYPNMAVDLARMPELFLHAKNDWQNTRNFFIRYQDRLLYATDVQVEKTVNPSALKSRAHDARLRYWTFFTSDSLMNEPNGIGNFKGLKLPREVVDKIYYKNALKWFPRIHG